MSSRTASGWLLAIGACIASGCCQPYGWVLKGDCALELNRVAWIGSRGDCYEGGGCCGGGAGGEAGDDYALADGPGVAPLDPAFHPVPMKHPYPPVPHEAPTPAADEDIPTPPDAVRAPAASIPRRLSDGAQRASWSYGRKPIKPLPHYGPPRKQPAMHVWRPTRS